jgi:hypothetical protein
MAPEQVRGDEAGPPADIYALGVLMYQMVVGELPFVAATATETALKRLTQPPPSPRVAVPDLDPRWEETILHCLAREPGERFQDVRDVLRSLRGEVRPRTQRRRRRAALGVAAVVAAGGLAAIAWVLIGHPKPWRAQVVEIPPLVDEDATWPMVSPDGKTIAFLSDRGDGLQQRLYLTPIEGGEVTLADPQKRPVETLRWARDGHGLLVSLVEKDHINLYRFEPGREPTLLGEDRMLFDDCGPAGIVYQRTTDREVVADGPNGTRTILKLPPDRGLAVLRCDAAGDRAFMAFALRHTSMGDLEAYVLTIADGSMRRIAEDERVRGGTITPDGKSIIYPALREGRQDLFERAIAGGSARRLTDGMGPAEKPDISPDGKTLIFEVFQLSTPVFALSLQGGSAHRLTTDGAEYAVQGATAREVLAVQTATPKRLLAIPLDGGPARYLTDADFAAIVPGSDELVYATTREVFAMPLAGSAVRKLGDVPGQIVGLAVGDGAVYLRLAVGETRRAARLPLTGGALELIAPETVSYVIPAPIGGRRVVVQPGFEGFLVDESEPIDSKAHPIGKALNFAWAPDGESLFTMGMQGVTRVTLDGKRTPIVEETVFKVALSPDGQTIYYAHSQGRAYRVRMPNFAERPR